DAEALRGHEVPQLVEGDRGGDAHEEQDDPHEVEECGHPRASPASRSRTNARAHASAASTSARVSAGAASLVASPAAAPPLPAASRFACAASAAAIPSAMPVKGICRSWKASTSTSFAAL